MRLRILLLAACLITVTAAAWVIAQETLPEADAPGAPAQLPPTDARHYSYAIGLDVGSSFKSDQLKLDVESLMAGVRDGLSGAKPQYSPELCGAAVQALARERAAVLLKRSRDFLAENAKKDGIQVTPSGLQYKVLKSGDGPSPTATSTVKANYRGQFLDGTVFDASRPGVPATFQVGRVIDGWTEALQKMKVGDKWQLFVPPELAYGPQGFGDDIPPNAALIFDVELVGVE